MAANRRGLIPQNTDCPVAVFAELLEYSMSQSIIEVHDSTGVPHESRMDKKVASGTSEHRTLPRSGAEVT
eukprot:2711594-Prymnesium_polylepis.1